MLCLNEQELSKKQQQLEQAHSMLLKHHEKTQELEYKQQKSVHNLREDQINKQHASELQNQKDYMDRAEKDLMRKHAVELKQQPKSLKVSHARQSAQLAYKIFIRFAFFVCL